MERMRSPLAFIGAGTEAHTPCTCDQCVMRVMHAALIGKDYGLDLAQARINGVSEFPVLSWEYVQAKMREYA